MERDCGKRMREDGVLEIARVVVRAWISTEERRGLGWRGRRAAREVVEREGADWDARIINKKHIHGSYTADDISQKVLRTFLFLFSRHSRLSFHGSRAAKNVGRIAPCFKLLLDSISSIDPQSNYCSLAIGSLKKQSRWVYQVHKILELCSAVLANDGSAWNSIEGARTILPGLAMRVMIAMRDASMWKSSSLQESRDKANLVVLGLLEWLVKGNSDLFPAVRSYVLNNFRIPKTIKDNDHPPERDKFIVTASAITMALRPLTVLSAAYRAQLEVNDGNQTLEASCVCIAESFPAHILTIHFIVQRIPPSFVPAPQHPSALAPCLRSFGISMSGLQPPG